MLSFEIKGGLESAKKFVHELEIFSFAESLGGFESLDCSSLHNVSCSA